MLSRAIDSLLSAIRSSLIIAYFTGVKPFLRHPFWSLNYAISPLAIMFFAHLYGGPKYLSYALIGGLVSVTVATTIIVESDLAFYRIVLKLQDMYVASPVGPITYAMGIALGNAFAGFSSLAVLIFLINFYIAPPLIANLIMLGGIVLTWIMISALGFLIASRAKELKDLWTFSPIITALFSFLPPVYYPLDLLPIELRPLAYLAPTFITARIIQSSFGLIELGANEVLSMIIGGAIYMAVVGLLLLKYARWRES